MKTAFDVGDVLYLPVTVAEIKILSNNHEVYKVDIPGCGHCYWYSKEDFLVFKSEGLKKDESET